MLDRQQVTYVRLLAQPTNHRDYQPSLTLKTERVQLSKKVRSNEKYLDWILKQFLENGRLSGKDQAS